MSDVLAFFIRLGQAVLWLGLVVVVFAPAIKVCLVVLVVMFIIALYSSLDAYATRVEEAYANRRLAKGK